MVRSSPVLVRVPATTANLGPGYDCLALSLDIWNEIEFSITGNALSIEIEGEGAEVLPRDATNLIFRCMDTFARYVSIPLPQGLQIKCANKIPVSSGLGSSASAAIAGLLGARALLGASISDHDILKLALNYEGHADNISACLLGGLVLSVLSENVLLTKKIPVKPLYAVIALPDIKISTHQARSILPRSIALEDGIFNLARVALLIATLQEDNYSNLKTAMQDRLHQSHRYRLIPGAEQAISGALESGAYGAALSGAGPCVIAFADENDKVVSQQFTQAFNKAGITSRILNTFSTNLGAQVLIHNK